MDKNEKKKPVSFFDIPPNSVRPKFVRNAIIIGIVLVIIAQILKILGWGPHN